MRTRRRNSGMTVLEIMIVIAIIGGMAFIVRSGFRLITKADLVEDANELSAIMRRTGQLAIERGEMHRLVIDLDSHFYGVEVCQGQTAIVRNEALRPDEETVKRALEKGKQRLSELPPDALAAGDPDEAVRRATAVSGHHIADKQCAPATEGMTGIVKLKPAGSAPVASGSGSGAQAQEGDWQRKLRAEKGIKFKEVWVQHRDESTTKGQVAIYFFPVGSAEKAVVEMTDGSETFTIVVHGLTGRVELKDGALRDVDEHMLRNALGEKDAEREEAK